jgi:hypothetical protein
LRDRIEASTLQQWRAAVGEEHVIVAESTWRAAETATFATSQRIPPIVRPGTREELAQCPRIANRWRAPVYPISGGKNWGYGSRVPPSGGCAFLGLLSGETICTGLVRFPSTAPGRGRTARFEVPRTSLTIIKRSA